MTQEGTKRNKAEILNQETSEEHESYDYEEHDDWKRLEKWRPGRKNFP